MAGRTNLRRTVMVAGILWFACLTPCVATSQIRIPENPLGKPVQPTDDFWETSPHTQEAAAAQVVGAAVDPFLCLTLRVAGRHRLVWGQELLVTELPVDERQAPPLDRTLLMAVQDDRPFDDLREKPPDEWTDRERAEVQLIADALVNAARTPLESFRASAKVNRNLTWAHLFRDPVRHRGKVVTFRGKLVRLREREAPQAARKRELIPAVYEGWVLVENFEKYPVSVLFTSKPENIPVAERMSYPIEFSGYFIKRWLYKGGDGKLHRTLHFVAPGFETETSVTPGMQLSESLLTGAVAVLITAVIVIIGLVVINWWYRRDDARVHKRVEDLRLRNVHLPGEEEEATAAPLARRVAVDASGSEQSANGDGRHTTD